jgi:hypothetical protein
MKWTRGAIITSSVIALGMGCAELSDSHHLRPTWILWKHHLWPYDPDLMKYLNVDTEFTRSLQGCSKSEFQRWFPSLVLSTAQFSDKGTGELYWIKGTDWRVWIKEGKVADIGMIKG